MDIIVIGFTVFTMVSVILLTESVNRTLEMDIKDIITSDYVITSRFEDSKDIVKMSPLYIASTISESISIPVAPRVSGTGLIMHEKHSRAIHITGISPEIDRNVSRLSERIVNGNYDMFLETHGNLYPAIIGDMFLEGFNLSIYSSGPIYQNNTFSLTMGKARDGNIITIDFIVVASFSTRLTQMDNSMVFVPLEAASFLKGYSVVVADSFIITGRKLSTEEYTTATENFLDENWSLFTSEEYMMLRYKNIAGDNSPIITFIWAVSIMGMAAKIIHSATSSIFERMKEIGVMRAIGISKNTINYFYTSERSLISLFGFVFGIFFSMIFTQIVKASESSIYGVPIKNLIMNISLSLFTTTLLMVFLITVISQKFAMEGILRKEIKDLIETD